MKKYLFAAIAFALVAMTPTTASADSYVSGFGGANWDDTANGIESDTGYVVGAALGTKVKAVPGLRVEAELAFRQNDVSAYCLEAKHNTTSLMGNLVYDLNAAVGPFRPYVLAGVGFAHTEGVVENLSIATLEADGVAWQLGAGLNTQIADGVTAGVGYRYFAGPELEVFGSQLSDGTNHSVLASLTLSLN